MFAIKIGNRKGVKGVKSIVLVILHFKFFVSAVKIDLRMWRSQEKYAYMWQTYFVTSLFTFTSFLVKVCTCCHGDVVN